MAAVAKKADELNEKRMKRLARYISNEVAELFR